jgi:protein-L-isoaspartate(D-aspartate) O-methyltransferase
MIFLSSITRAGAVIGLSCLFLLLAGLPVGADDFAQKRQALVKVIEADVRDTSLYLDKEALDDRVLQALSTVPRHLFVPKRVVDQAYENRALPIGYSQTISQPYIVAIMTDLLKPTKDSRVLEIGTGSGYQAAVMAEIVDQVYTMEIVKPLADQATQRLKQLGYDNIEVRHKDGYYGWNEQAPFDLIIVTAASSHVPPPLIAQLKPGGRMIIPVGSPFLVQQLVLVEKASDGRLSLRQILPVMFVPLTGGHEDCGKDCVE